MSKSIKVKASVIDDSRLKMNEILDKVEVSISIKDFEEQMTNIDSPQTHPVCHTTGHHGYDEFFDYKEDLELYGFKALEEEAILKRVSSSLNWGWII